MRGGPRQGRPNASVFEDCNQSQVRAPLRDISSHVSGCVRILTSAADISALLVGSTSRPWCRVDIMSTGPPFLVATVGTPCAAACARAPNPGYIRSGWQVTLLVWNRWEMRCMAMVCTGPTFGHVATYTLRQTTS